MKDGKDIAYFELMKDLPGCPAGASFSIYGGEGEEEYIFSGNIKFPVWFTAEYTDWFRPVYMNEYRANFKKSFIYYAINDRGCNQAEAERRWELFLNDTTLP